MTIDIDRNIWLALPMESNASEQHWHDGHGVSLVLNHLGFDHDLYSRLSDEMAVRTYYRNQFALQQMGIVECDVLEKAGTKLVRVVGKVMNPARPGMIYIASLAIPLRDKSFVFTLHAQEGKLTGLRDNVILNRLLSQGQITFDPKTESLKAWAQDPYFATYQGPCLRNLSEDKQYDQEFPDHPLSKVRFRVDELLKFIELPSGSTRVKKPWWKL
ncbi:hypothetical protein [Thiolinea disciformis]|uniref:hypothetical protein n=1 Tax=Thiolinea disciformis TaxID=125614 RepID=UPI0003765034|nr:hypothetical protein [Thiolinea disciformis]